MKHVGDQALIIAKRLQGWLNIHIPRILAASPHSLRNYKTSVKLYITYLEETKSITPNNFDADCFSRDNIEDWIIWLQDVRKSSASTCNLRLSGLRSFLKYLSECEVQFMDAFLQSCTIPNQKTLKKKVVGLSKDGVKALFNAPNTRTDKGFRDFVMLMTLYTCALRISELLSLTIGNVAINCTKPHITVIGKGRKIRTIPVLAKPAKYLSKYIANHPDKDNPDAFLFYTKNKGIYGPMTARNLDKLIKKYAKLAANECSDMPLTLHAHQLRHAKATHWLENGMNLAQISHLLGHENIQTTMIYLDITTEQELKALMTLEDENQKKMKKSWKTTKNDSLREFLGLK